MTKITRVGLGLFIVCLVVLLVFLLGISKESKKNNRPNIVLIFADDIGFEAIESFGGTEYKTPNLTKLASQGVQFNRAISSPMCTPSRVKIMTGKYNFRNYIGFSKLDKKEKTFANSLKRYGYKTVISGKWQLGNKEIDLPNSFGFDQYFLSEYKAFKDSNDRPIVVSRYHSPLINSNGMYYKGKKKEYGPDLFCDFILNFIEKNQKDPFFVYYPMVLTHWPFVPTPKSKNPTKASHKENFVDMVEYMDYNVGRIVKRLEELSLIENTVILFTGDNGSYISLSSKLKNNTMIRGGKSYQTRPGIHVPMIASWKGKLKDGMQNDDLIDLIDFLPTLEDIAQIKKSKRFYTDGISFLPQILGEAFEGRKWIFQYYKSVNMRPDLSGVFVMNKEWKLYADGRLYNIKNDMLETKIFFAFNDTKESLKNRQALNLVFEDLYKKNKTLEKKALKLQNKMGQVIAHWEFNQIKVGKKTILKYNVEEWIQNKKEVNFGIFHYKGMGGIEVDKMVLKKGNVVVSQDLHQGNSFYRLRDLRAPQKESYQYLRDHNNNIFTLKADDVFQGKGYTLEISLKGIRTKEDKRPKNEIYADTMGEIRIVTAKKIP